MRSKLFVPGSGVELFRKALATNADSISFDLEDAVVTSRKAEARKNVATFINAPEMKASGKGVIVRTNGIDTKHFEADVMAVVVPALDIINLPKLESAEEVCAAVDVIERAEHLNGVKTPIRLLANIETARGLLMAPQIAGAHPRMAGLQLGLNDLSQSLGFDRKDSANVHAAMFAVRMAAGSAGIFAVDGAFVEMKDAAGFCAEAEQAFRLGFIGKSCIHPNQIPFANEIFAYSDDEVVLAKRILEESSKALAKGLGVFSVEGKMIDLPLIRRAEMVVASQGTRGGKPLYKG